MPEEKTLKQSRIVILGAGVAGLRVAKEVSSKIDPKAWEVVLINENDYHQYLYRIHEVCNVNYSEKEVIVPILRVINERKVTFKLASVQSIDTHRRAVITDKGEEPYDILVITLGSHPAYFNIPGIRENCMTLMSFKEAQALRQRIRDLVGETMKRGVAPRIVIGGAGFTGVELAGELTDSLPVLYREHNIPKPKILLTIVEALSTILPGWNEKLIGRGQIVLQKRGVDLKFKDPIARVSANNVELKSGLVLEMDLLIWTGGVTSDPSCGEDFEFRSRRIVVDEFCRAEGRKDIYVAGDMACTTDAKGNPQPPTAHIAMVQGGVVAHNILSEIRGGEKVKYSFSRAGEIVTLGRTDAVGELFGLRFYGVIGKFLKKVIHWRYLYSIGGIGLLFD